MIRGLLILLFAGPENKKRALSAAAAMELMHSGILIHDDIMDRDVLRRGLPTIHIQYTEQSEMTKNSEALHYGESMASCVAISSYFLALAELSKIPDNSKLLNLFGREMSVLGIGQMEDIDITSRTGSANEKSALRVCEQKTGRYTFALPIMAGLIISGVYSKKYNQPIYNLAKQLGIIFQIKDDLLAIVGDSSKTGKSVGGDIRERKQTWLYFKTLKLVGKSDSGRLKELYDGEQLLSKTNQQWVLGLMQSSGAIASAEKTIRRYHQEALLGINKLPLTDNQSKIMTELLDYLVIREK